MTDQATNAPDPLDTTSTVRLTVRSALMAQIEAVLLSEKVSVSIADEKARGKDPYNQVPLRADTWGKG